MGDHHDKRRSTEKEIDLKDGKIKLYISINVYNENHLKNSNVNENESVVSTDVTNKVGDINQEESVTEQVRERKSTSKKMDHNSARLLNLVNKKKQSNKRR